jgi:uncharacterized protein (TIGR03083 family)
MDTWPLTERERITLADDLAALDPGEWDAPSLCSQWQVRHVVAHLIAGATMGTRATVAGLVRNGFNFNRFMARDALARGDELTPSELLFPLRAGASSETTAPMSKPADALLEVVVHGQDIRRPLGIPQHLPGETLVCVADRLKHYGFPFGTKKRIAGLQLEATDASWTTGSGALVVGTLEALIMVMAGRPHPLPELSGEGAATLRDRLTSTPV